MAACNSGLLQHLPAPLPASSGQPALCCGVAALAQSHFKQAGPWELITWLGTRAPNPNTLVPSAPSCVRLADLSVMPPQGEQTHCSSYS
jgi:hypothetical protein